MCWKRLAANTGPKNSPKIATGHHRTTLLGHIFATNARIDNRKKTLSSNVFSTYSHNMVNFSPLAAEIDPVAPQLISTGFVSWQRYCMALQIGHQPNFAALNRGRHLYSAGRPSRWALAHILVNCICFNYRCSA